MARVLFFSYLRSRMPPPGSFSKTRGFATRPANSRCRVDHLSPAERSRFLDVAPGALQTSVVYRLNALARVCDERVSQLRYVRKLGQGSFGIVLLCRGVFKGVEIDVAVKELHAGSIGKQTRAEVDNEARLALRMGLLGAGPAVYDLFFAEVTDGRRRAVFQYVLMEPFAASVSSVLRSNRRELGLSRSAVVAAVVPAMLAVMRRHLEAGVQCYDVKPGNFVVRRAGAGVEVKMIDFGFPHCNIEREKDCTRAACDHTPPGGKALFVCLCAQVLHMARRDAGRALDAAVMRAAEGDRVWRERGRLRASVLAEFGRNEDFRWNYNWYVNGATSAGDEQRLARQFEADIAPLPAARRPARRPARPEREGGTAAKGSASKKGPRRNPVRAARAAGRRE